MQEAISKSDVLDESGVTSLDLTSDSRRLSLLPAAQTKKLKQDPFLPYGVGIVNYFMLQRKLICLMFLISIIASI